MGKLSVCMKLAENNKLYGQFKTWTADYDYI